MLFFCLRKPRIEILIFQLISTRNYVNFWYLSTPRRSASIYWRNGPTKLGPRKSIFNFVKNGPILLIFGVWNQLMKRFHHTNFQQNRTIFDEVPKFWTRAQKWFDFAEIRCDEIFGWVDFTHQIWAKLDHFWQSWKITFWALTLSAFFGENWNITSVDLKYVKFQVIWSWN